MIEDLIECSCCGKLVPAANIELAYRRPDVIASLSSEELEARSTHTDDICILDGERFFVRCTISLPIRMSSEYYAIGAWAEISERDFATVQKLWDEVDQANAPAIDGVLANQIALTTGSSGCRVLVTLTGPTTRPCIAIKDQACSMYLEQKEGLPAHRASEYANVCRKRASDCPRAPVRAVIKPFAPIVGTSPLVKMGKSAPTTGFAYLKDTVGFSRLPCPSTRAATHEWPSWSAKPRMTV